ncbi:MAG: RluA family pseudouridine synthase [Candidatus Omnitrophota bacterium]|nr:RluA family pseudouridine synthase [Candidatus Omnitrophota bacterium]
MWEFRKIEIIYVDNYLVVANKPAGMLVVPTPKKEIYTLSHVLNQQFETQSANELFPCHRLDRDTSGLIVYARGRKIQELVMRQFRQHQVKKKYIAFVHGRLKKTSGFIENFIEDVPIGGKRYKHQRKLAVTNYQVKEERKNYSIVAVEPVTGRTNQIRIHFKQMGNPLVGERKYAFARDFPIKFRRVALHASQIGFRHPVTGKKITLSCSLPEDMARFMEG